MLYICLTDRLKGRFYLAQKATICMALITVDPKLLYTKSEYAKAFGINRVKLDQDIKDRKVKTLAVKGGVIVVAERG